MKHIAIRNGFKWLLLTLVLMAGFAFANVHAKEGDACTTNADCDVEVGEVCQDAKCAMPALGTGGAGLSIEAAKGEATISKDIVQGRTLGAVITDMVNYFIGFLGFLAVIVFVYAGILFILNLGNEEMVTKAKKMMMFAALGLIIVTLSYSAVRFITSAAQRGCTQDSDCTSGRCVSNVCTPITVGATCATDAASAANAICPTGYECKLNGNTNKWECTVAIGEQAARKLCEGSNACPQGFYCAVEKKECVQGKDLTCAADRPCPSPKQCDDFGLCRNPNAGADTVCTDNTDCYTGYVCNVDKKKCEYQGTGGIGGVTGGPSQGAANESVDAMEQTIQDLLSEIAGLQGQISQLSDAMRGQLTDILGQGTLGDKLAGINDLLDKTEDPEAARVLERIAAMLEKLQDLRQTFDRMKEDMPESEDTIKTWDEASELLNALIDEPLSTVKAQRFDAKYKKLKELIRKFPVVQAVIHAEPGEGNVPFTVTFDGLDSVDPTGGTISQYKWSYLDNKGNQVSLGGDPVLVHEFTEPNTYSVKLQASTSQKDKAGYKTAMDGVSVVRIKANPPASKVAFRINGVEASDVYHATEKEGKAGMAFDPSSTVPALGRVIQKYEWLYGDTATEQRSVPTTVVHTYEKPGEYYVTLKVTDNHDVADKKTVKLYVKSVAADIRVTPKDGNVNTEFHFQGVDSRSDDGTIKNYQWSIEDMEGNAVASSEEQDFYHKFTKPGDYKIILLVTDTPGSKDKHLVVLQVHSRPPVASFTYTIPKANHPNTVEFNGVNSYDPDEGDRIKYSWDFDGDGNFDVVNTADIRTAYTYKKTGEYKAVLQVTDSFGQTNQISKAVTINSVLSGDITLDKSAGQVGEKLTFKASSPNAIAYLWEFGDGETSSTEEKSVTYEYKKKGKYKVKLNFFDKEDNTNADTAYVLVGDRDAPIAVAKTLIDNREPAFIEDLCGQGKNGIVVTRADNILFSAKDSINRDGSTRMLSYDWRFSDGNTNSRKEFNHKFDEVNRSGECFSVNLAVRDQVSGKVSDEDILYFNVINQLPTVTDFVLTSVEQGKELVTPTKVRLKVVNPKDADGQVKKYKWWYYREGNEDKKLGVHTTGSPETEMIITAEGEPDTVNKYFFIVEITDNDNGVYDSTERFGELSYLDVKNGPNLSPVTEFNMDKTTISVGDSITFVSTSYDPQGDTLPNDAFKWDFDGDGEFDDVTSGPQVSRQYNTPGEYNPRLKVVYRGLSSSATKKIFVEPTNALPQAAFTYKISGDTVSFDGSNSRYDPSLADKTLRFEWDFDVETDANGNGIKDDDVESTEVNPTHTYPAAGIYRVRLKIKDSLGMEGVVVREVNLAIDQAQREKNAKSSIVVSSPAQPLTSLNIMITPVEVMKNGTADIEASVLNADNSPYYGQVFFEVVEGSGDFSPNPVDAKESKAATVFSPIDSGTIRIKVRATNTYYGEITEDITIKVK